MQTSTTPTRRRARRARVAKTVTSQALASSGKVDDASLPGGSGITELWGLAVSKTAAGKILAGEVTALAKTTDHPLANREVVLLHKGLALGTVELGKQLEARTWEVKAAKAYERPKATNVSAEAEGVVAGVRLLDRRKATAVDEPVTKRGAKTYDPYPVVDRVLLADVRTLAEWGEEVALTKAIAEVERRGLEMAPAPALELAPDTEPETLATSELLAAHQALHKINKRDAVAMHAQIVAELADRGVAHPEPPAGLDTLSQPLEPERVAVEKSDAEAALVELVASVEQYPVLVHKRVDGVRVTVAKAAGQVKIVGEDGADLTAEVPAVVEAVRALKAERVDLEGDLETWHGGDLLQVSDLTYDGRDLRDWPIAKRLERLAELGIGQATATVPSLRVPINELPAIRAADATELERAVRVLKAAPGSSGAVVKPEASISSGEWHELEAEPVAKVASSEPVPFVQRGAELLVGVPGGRRVERWTIQEKIAKRHTPQPWGALRGESTDRGVAELGAAKPWSREYFLRGEGGAYRLLIRKAQLGELQKAAHSYTSCMACKSAPVVDVLWADGRGRAWFCKGCYPKWLHKGGGAKTLEVVGTKAVLGGRAPAKYSDRHNRVTMTKAAEPSPLEGDWLVVRTEDPTPQVLQLDAVAKRWIPPLGVSALPEAVAKQVPAELAYWQRSTLAEAREARDLLVQKLDAGEVTIDYTPAPVEVSQIDTKGEVTKSDTVQVIVSIAKIDSDRQIVTGIVLEPDTVDAQNDTVTDEVIAKASIDFLSRFNSETQLGVMHRVFGDVGLQLAASWVALSNCTLGKKKVKQGSWLMSVKVVDPKLWARIKKGEFTGFSVGGVARVRDGNQKAA